MKVGISANPDIRNVPEVVRKIVDSSEEHGIDTVLEKGIAESLGSSGTTLEKMPEEGAEILITVGGDGTILRALQHINLPILGVNKGRLGFLNEVKESSIDDAVKRISTGKYNIALHERITAVIDGEMLPPVLNEVVIHSSQALKIRDFKLYVDKNLVDSFRADGVIIATPTGSTGYALSAGGPILDPRLDGVLIMPLLPFRIAKRPNVVPMSSRIRIELADKKSSIAVLDGQKEISLGGSENIEIIKSDEPAKFLRFKKTPYNTRQRMFASM